MVLLHSSSKSWNFLNAGNGKVVFCYVTWKAPKGWAWLLEDPILWLEGWNFQSHLPELHPTSWERRGARDGIQLPMVSNLIGHAYDVLGGSAVKNPPVTWEMQVQSRDQGDP